MTTIQRAGGSISHTTATRREALRLYDRLGSHRIGQIVGANNGTVLAWVRAAGLEVRPARPMRQERLRARVKALLEDGFSQRVAARLAGCNRTTVQRVAATLKQGGH